MAVGAPNRVAAVGPKSLQDEQGRCESILVSTDLGHGFCNDCCAVFFEELGCDSSLPKLLARSCLMQEIDIIWKTSDSELMEGCGHAGKCLGAIWTPGDELQQQMSKEMI